jgi:hypothetical protein
VQIRAQSLHYPALIHEMRVLAAALLLAAVSAAREFRCRIYPPLIMARGGVPYPSLSSPLGSLAAPSHYNTGAKRVEGVVNVHIVVHSHDDVGARSARGV